MSDQAAPEPTMEEILASIRRIISEDDTPGEEAEAEAPAPAPAAAAAPAARTAPLDDESGDEELELVHRVGTPKESVGDIDAYEKTEPPPARNEPPPCAAAPAPEPRPMPKPQPAPARDDAEGLVSSPSAFAAASAFGQLSAAISMPAAGRTLEDLVTELMKPLLKDWLDQNLAAIVEAKVADEVERIARGRVR